VIYFAWYGPGRQANQPPATAQNRIDQSMPSAANPRTNPALQDRNAQQTQADHEIFRVARDHEVTIIRVEGEDAQTLVVGKLPLEGNMELAGRGDVELIGTRPNVNDRQRNPVRLIESPSPMLWANLDSEKID
jgi:hypothetical protein